MKRQLEMSEAKVAVFRDKRGAVATAVLACIACLALAGMFYHLASYQSGFWFFCVAFGLAGISILVLLPRLVNQILRGNGALVFSANALGLSVTKGLGASQNFFPWTAITEIIVAERLKFIDSGESSWLRNALIVFLMSGDTKGYSLITRLKTGVSMTAQERFYFITSYPAGQYQPLMSALGDFAPRTLPVSFQQQLIFDAGTGTVSSRKKKS